MSGGDDAVQSTNDDATLCKLSAVSMGYWSDPFLPHMAKPSSRDRRAPEIHLGYYARVAGVRLLVDKFFEACDTAVQVINLGAGFDTTFWRLLEEGRPVKNFVEIDFAGVSARKCHLIKRHKELMGLVAGEEADIRLSKTDLHSTRCDIRPALQSCCMPNVLSLIQSFEFELNRARYFPQAAFS